MAVPPLVFVSYHEPDGLQSSINSEAEVWRDENGEVFGYCQFQESQPRVDVAGVGSFCYQNRTGRVGVVLHRALPSDAVIEIYNHWVIPVMLPALGTEVIHASAVVGTDGVTAFCAESGTGKSTVVVGLAHRGYAVWADDAVGVETISPQVQAIPLPFVIRLRPASEAFFGSVDKTQRRMQPAPLTRLCVLRRAPEATAPTVVRRLDGASACQAVLAHAYCFSVTDSARKRRTVENYLNLTARVPVYEIQFRPGFEHLAALLDSVEALIR